MTHRGASLDEVVAEILSAPTSRRGLCWVADLEGDAAELVRRLTELERSGTRIPRQAALKKLRDWGVAIGASSLRRHLVGECGCRP